MLRMDRSNPDWGLLLRCLLVIILIALLGLSPTPHNARQAMEQARRAMDDNAPGRAAAALEQAWSYFPWRIDLRLLAGRAAFQAGEADSAIEHLEFVASQGALSSQDRVSLGDAYLASGDASQALASWKTALKDDPQLAEAHQRLADFYLSQGDYPAAISALKDLFALKPAEIALSYQIGLLLSATQPESALPYLAQAAADPSLAAQAGELQRRIEIALVSEEPAYSLTSAGRALAALGEWELAEEAFTRATQARPDYAEAWAYLGEAHQHQGSAASQAGLIELEKALQLDPASIAGNVFTALYWGRQGEHQAALQFLQAAAAADPENPALQIEIGATLAEMGDLPTAQTYYERATQLEPNNPSTWRALAEFALTHQIQTRQIALPAARRAVILAPDDPPSLDIMGLTLLALGDYHSAEAYLNQAITLQPDYVPAQLHLGIVYQNLGDLTHARDQFNLVRQLAPDTWAADQAQRWLDSTFP